MDSLAQRQTFLDDRVDCDGQQDSSWRKFRVLLGKPGTGKSQVLIRAIHQAVQQECSVLLAAPVALLAQGYRAIFGPDLECDTLHAAFHIPVQPGQSWDVNFSLNRFDMVVVDEASLVSPASFDIVAATLNRLNCRPVVVIAGDRCQQQPLQTVQGRVCNTVSILNDDTFGQENAVKHSLYQQFRIIDREYEAFVEMVRYVQPSQRQLDQFQGDLVLCPAGSLTDDEIYCAFSHQAQTSIMTVSRAAAQRINTIVLEHLFAGKFPAPKWLAVLLSSLTRGWPSSSTRTATRGLALSMARIQPSSLRRVTPSSCVSLMTSWRLSILLHTSWKERVMSRDTP